MITRLPGILLLSCLLLPMTLPVSAVEPDTPMVLAQAGGPDAAAAAVRRATGGRVLSVQAGERNGQPGYWVKVLFDEDGRVQTLWVDGRTGRVER